MNHVQPSFPQDVKCAGIASRGPHRLRAHRGRRGRTGFEPHGLFDVGAGDFRFEVRLAVAVRPRRPAQDVDSFEPEESVRDRAGAVGHGVARAVGRGGPERFEAHVHAVVSCPSAGQGPGGVHLSGRSLPVVGGRHGVFLLLEGALRSLRRETSSGRADHVLPSIAGRGLGASGATGGLPVGRRSRFSRATGRGRTTASATPPSAC